MALSPTDLTGIFPALVTAMHDDESLDLEGVRAHARRMLVAGAHGLFALGTNGEFFVLTAEERVAVLEAIVAEAAGTVPVFAGAGMVGTRETVALAERLVTAGADVLSVISPYFAAASQDELYRHFRVVAESVDVPVLLYNIPARTGVSIAPTTVARLAEVDNIVGIKDSSGNFDNILQYLELTDRESFSVIAGSDSLILWTLLAGGTGGVTAVANVYPATMVSIYEHWKAGDMVSARAAQDSIRPLRNLFRWGNPNTVIKAATNAAGSSVGSCRAPFNGLGDEALADIARVVTAGVGGGLS